MDLIVLNGYLFNSNLTFVEYIKKKFKSMLNTLAGVHL